MPFYHILTAMARKLSKKYKDLLLRLISHDFIFHLNKIMGFCTIRRKGKEVLIHP